MEWLSSGFYGRVAILPPIEVKLERLYHADPSGPDAPLQTSPQPQIRMREAPGLCLPPSSAFVGCAQVRYVYRGFCLGMAAVRARVNES
jgi:hypothetical protein